MPEQPPRRRGKGARLSHAINQRQIVTTKCAACNSRHHYYPEDLQKLFGDIECDDIQDRIRCDRCAGRETMRVSVHGLAASERQAIRMRRLVDIKIRKVPVWRDEPG